MFCSCEYRCWGVGEAHFIIRIKNFSIVFLNGLLCWVSTDAGFMMIRDRDEKNKRR